MEKNTIWHECTLESLSAALDAYQGILKLGTRTFDFQIIFDQEAACEITPLHVDSIDISTMRSLFDIIIASNGMEIDLSDAEYAFFHKILIPFIGVYDKAVAHYGQPHIMLERRGMVEVDDEDTDVLLSRKFAGIVPTFH